ncbi:hypothetical protein H5410_061436, partial [Solanum commersonii]
CLKICAAEDQSAQLVESTDTFNDPPFGRFHCLLALAFNIFTLRVVGAQHTGTKGDLQADRRLANWAWRSSSLHFFVLFSRLVPSCQFKKDVSNSAIQDLIMNVHNKTQFTQARINCVSKDSSCDTPLPKILKLAILPSNASSSSTKVFECPHRNDDSIFTNKGLII